MATIVERLAAFTTDDSRYERLPAEVAHETKRLLLDSIGCALAAQDEFKGKAGVEYGRIVGAGDAAATIIGTPHKVSITGAAFANAELINTLDADAVLPPGHVTPYVLPGALAAGEAGGASGKTFIESQAAAHEMSFRLGRATDNQRDSVDGELVRLKVFGYASTIFGATAALAHVKGLPAERIAHALGIAGYISTINPQVAWFEHVPVSTVKYLAAGVMPQQAFTAATMAELGHRGDLEVLDDAEYGYRRFIGSLKWAPEHITAKLGEEWLFPAFTSYKIYPHCRIMHGMMDCLIDIVRREDLKPAEIEAIKVYVEGIAVRPCWVNRTIVDAMDSQFSMAHGISVAAHLTPPGKAWMDPKVIHDPSVLSLMDRVTTEVHPDYVKLLSGNAASRPARVEVRARGQVFVGEKRYPKGSPSPDPESFMTDQELIAKFRHNADGVLTAANADALIDRVMNLEQVKSLAEVMDLARVAAPRRAAAE